MKWYTAYTKQNCEKKVSAILSRKKIIHYCPVNAFIKGETKTKSQQIFSGYVFVKVRECELTSLKQIKGVNNFLYWMQKPAVISESEINLIKSFLDEHVNVKIEKRQVGFNNIFYNTPQKENEAKLINLNYNKIKVALPSLGYVMIADFEKSVVPISLNNNTVSNLKPEFTYQIAK